MNLASVGPCLLSLSLLEGRTPGTVHLFIYTPSCNSSQQPRIFSLPDRGLTHQPTTMTTCPTPFYNEADFGTGGCMLLHRLDDKIKMHHIANSD